MNPDYINLMIKFDPMSLFYWMSAFDWWFDYIIIFDY